MLGEALWTLWQFVILCMSLLIFISKLTQPVWLVELQTYKLVLIYLAKLLNYQFLWIFFENMLKAITSKELVLIATNWEYTFTYSWTTEKLTLTPYFDRFHWIQLDVCLWILHLVFRLNNQLLFFLISLQTYFCWAYLTSPTNLIEIQMVIIILYWRVPLPQQPYHTSNQAIFKLTATGWSIS